MTLPTPLTITQVGGQQDANELPVNFRTGPNTGMRLFVDAADPNLASSVQNGSVLMQFPPASAPSGDPWVDVAPITAGGNVEYQGDDIPDPLPAYPFQVDVLVHVNVGSVPSVNRARLTINGVHQASQPVTVQNPSGIHFVSLPFTITGPGTYDIGIQVNTGEQFTDTKTLA